MELIKQAIALKKILDQLRPLSADDEQRIMQKFRLDWNYHSNNLEGNSLTYGETKALILFGTTAQGKPLKDHFEMTGHNQAVNWIIDIVKGDEPITENFIRQVHTLLLKEPYEVDAITPEGKSTKKLIKVGSYKETPNHVKTKTGEIFRFATPEETPAKMHDLIAWYRAMEEQKAEPILLAAEFHYKFIRIHPFDDGNGRLARLLMNFILMKHGYPPVIVKTGDKENYFAALRLADTGSINAFFEYITLNLIHSLELMISGAKGEDIEEKDDIDKEIALLHQMVDNAGKSFGLERSKKAILNVIDNGISELFESVVEQGQKFDSFYKDAKIKLILPEGRSLIIGYRTFNEEFKRLLNYVDDQTSQLYLECNYSDFYQKGFKSINFEYLVMIKFKEFGYEIMTNKSEVIIKKYSEKLNERETSNILKAFKNAHLEQIETIIKNPSANDNG